jgi:1-aminocyclopropane-1-carboxylate synthase
MLICNPHNPLGTPVSRKTLLGYCRFAQKYDLHLVSDEIYAMSVYDSREFSYQPMFNNYIKPQPVLIDRDAQSLILHVRSQPGRGEGTRREL